MKYCWYWMDQQVRMRWNRPGSLRLLPTLPALAITKLDGTAKGGVVLAIANQFKTTGEVHRHGREDGRPAGV